MKWLVCVGVLLAVLLSLASASAGSAEGRWKVLARATGGQNAVVGVGKNRATRFAIRAKVKGTPNTVKVHALVLCSKDGYLGPVTFSRSERFTLTGSAMKVLELPIAYPEMCGVTAIGISRAFDGRVVGRLTLQILVPCTVQTSGALSGACIA
jgi:hypothetical protein